MRAGTSAPDIAIGAVFMIMLAQPMRRVRARKAEAQPRVRYNQPWERQSPDWRVILQHFRCPPIWRLAFLGKCATGVHRDFRREQRTQKTRTAAPQRRPIA